ncbi:MAG: pyruvate kinase, partial [Candidatus Gastranaerophilales bacterium]|nr:pyruvate kinase [Candidatus Gastranaerophilales bacterium]
MQQQVRTKTKIVATLGPSSGDYNTIKELITAGVSMFRINTSHGEKYEHEEKIKIIRQISDELNKNIPILIDLQGPKIRVGEIPSPIEIKKGQELILEHTKEIKDNILPVDYEGISRDVTPGEKIFLDDGKIRLKVVKIEDSKVYTEVENGTLIKPRKGINIPGSQTSLEAITKRDKEYIKFALNQQADYIALSFVRTAEDIKCAKYYIKAFGDTEIPVIAKIEKPQAVENLSQIIREADGVMVARGDLGIEMSPQEVPVAQKEIINMANIYKKPCIVATQMLESMIEQPIPTRAEANDVANAIYDGADAIMLSGETAVGKYPVESVEMMSLISQTVEKSQFIKTDYDADLIPDLNPISQAIAGSAVNISKKLNAKGILVFSEKGYTPKIISKLKPSVPVITVTNSGSIARKLSLFRGIYTFVDKNCNCILDEELFNKIDKLLVERAKFTAGDDIIIVNSAPKLMTGTINTV